MKVIIQRVQKAECIVDNQCVGTINQGLMVLIGFTTVDTNQCLATMAKKLVNLRIFNDENGKMNRSLIDINGEILAISQFTLYADTNNGNRPSFINVLNPTSAKILYEEFVSLLRNTYHIKVECGIFGADMKLYPVCDGPVTITLEF